MILTNNVKSAKMNALDEVPTFENWMKNPVLLQSQKDMWVHASKHWGEMAPANGVGKTSP